MSRIESAAATHVGRRQNNEDSLLHKPELGLFAVADGLGGHEGGEVASHLVVSTVADFIATRLAETPRTVEGEELLMQALRLAHHEVRGKQVGKLSTMASTLTVMMLEGTEARVCNLGDSRTFLLRRGEVRRLTRDHTVLTEMQEAGIDTSTPFALRHRNSLTGAVGMEDSVEPESTRATVEPGDMLLLASDGLYEPVPPELMLEQLARGGTMQEMVERLVTLAYDRGGTDNITGVLVRVLE